MIEYETVPSTYLQPVSMVCDRCGEKQEITMDMIEVRHQFGYGSQRDGDYIEFDLCENCLVEVIKNEKIKVREYSNEG